MQEATSVEFFRMSTDKALEAAATAVFEHAVRRALWPAITHAVVPLLFAAPSTAARLPDVPVVRLLHGFIQPPDRTDPSMQGLALGRSGPSRPG